MMACRMFYKVYSLAVDKDVTIISQVLLDDGNRIIIPGGNFQFLSYTGILEFR